VDANRSAARNVPILRAGIGSVRELCERLTHAQVRNLRQRDPPLPCGDSPGASPSRSSGSRGVVLFLSVLLVGAESLVSGRRVKGLRIATAHRAALDAVAASGTIGSEKTAVRCTGLLAVEPT